MKTNEIREKFLSFFANKGHEIVASSSLVPDNDPTLLFTNAGMNQFKDVFLGKEKRTCTRATSSQKCVRAGGKHNDLENVGFTARHHTFFEMLGNFSFGDYFKKEAIAYAWEFVTEILALTPDKLYVTVYKDDDEAYDIWTKQHGVAENRIFRLGDKDNFWQMGDTGPCGPCTELFVDRGPKYCDQEHGKCIETDHDCDRYIEFWNLVFMQFDRSNDGTLTPLPRPSVDTGAGLERIASIMQGVDSNYDIDTFREIIAKIEDMSAKKYVLGTKEQSYFRVIADHARAVSFLISDGVIPSNDGRGYVLRRIIRRAVRYGRELGFKGPFLNEVCIFVLQQMKEIFPELADKKSLVQKCVQSEEEQFFRTLEKGLALLDDELKSLTGQTLPGELAFKLYDTFGFPYDLTELIARERGIKIDQQGFERAMLKQKTQSRKSRKGDLKTGVDAVFHQLVAKLTKESKIPEFWGYTQTEVDSECVAILVDEDGELKPVESWSGEKTKCKVVFKQTPFYAEGGGQVADRGGIFRGAELVAEVVDVQKPTEGLIVVDALVSGDLRIGELYEQRVDRKTRELIKRNHTATHLLHGALRRILGDHVKQAGSLVNADLLRFDFTHFNALSRKEIKQIEAMVMAEIWAGYPVEAKITTKDEAVSEGAVAFFGEKYGSEVRVISAGSYSVELCGGTHVSNTSDIQLFKIISEGAVAAGVRRIVAYTSKQAYAFLNERYDETRSVREVLKAGHGEEVLQKLDKLMESEKTLRRQVESARAEQINRDLAGRIADAKKFSGGQLVSFLCPSDASGIKLLRTVSDQIRAQVPDSVVILGMKNAEAGKAYILAAVGKNAKSPITADQIIKAVAPVISGRGGGKADMAQAGGDDLAALPEALHRAQQMVLEKS